MTSGDKRRWTLYVCPECGGGCGSEPGIAGVCDCPFEGDQTDLPEIDKPIEVMAVAELRVIQLLVLAIGIAIAVFLGAVWSWLPVIACAAFLLWGLWLEDRHERGRP